MDSDSAALIDEEISILTTTWFPSHQEANAMKSRTIMRLEMIRQIDEEMAALQAQRNALVMACDISCAIMAPIRKLPVELLTEIFSKCIPPLSTKRSRLRPRYKVYPQDVGKLLGTVCRAWHTIVNDEPRIWSTVILAREIQAPEDINQLLKKSKSHPLDIFIKPRVWFPFLDQEGNYDVIFAMLRSELWRTRTFIADMGWCVGGDIFPQGFSINAPMMQTFSHICNSASPVGHDLDTFHGPRLSSITLQYSDLVRSLVANPGQTVRHLEVSFSHGSTALYLQLLSALPNLVSLYWKGKDDLEKVQQAPSTVALHSLKSLRLYTAGSPMDLVSFLRAPSLECLELLQKWGPVSKAPEIIGALCDDGVVKLRHLHILGGWLPPELGVGVMLGQLNCLETLIIERSDILYDLLIALSPQDRNFSSVCPQLTTLVISDPEIPADAFVDFVHRRTRADLEEAVPGLVTSLKLNKNTVHRSNARSYTHFAQTHSATIRFMSMDEYKDTSLLGHISQEEGDWVAGGWEDDWEDGWEDDWEDGWEDDWDDGWKDGWKDGWEDGWD